MTHTPVLLAPVLEMISGISHTSGLFVDATFGRGGHTREILNRFPDYVVLAIDADDEAIASARENFSAEIKNGRLELHHANYVEIRKVLNGRKPIGVLADLGVSSPQLDQGHRGFSFYNDGPLDMRMDRRQSLSAADIVNTWSEQELTDLFVTYGEVRRPGRVVKYIVHDRKTNPFKTTRDLAGLIERAEGWSRKGRHPATNYFLALRLAVNQELERVREGTPEMVDVLMPGGRALIITFHSLEDRIVKYIFKDMATEGYGKLVNKKVIQADRAEEKANPRARSAKLRVFEREER